MTLTQHPLSAAFPSMSDADFLALKDNIEDHGQREPIIIFEGMVLDGWHRYRACMELGLKPAQFNFDASEDPVAYVISQNLHRRHLTASQRAAAVVACQEWAPARRPNKSAPGAELPKTAKQLATMAGTGTRTIEQAKTAHKAGLGDAVKEGAVTAKEAASMARGTVPAKPKAKPAPESFGPDAAELAANAAEDLAYRESMEKVIESDDKLAAAAAEIKRLNSLVKVLESRNAGLMNEKNEAIRMAKSWQRKFEQASRVAA